MNIQEAEQWLKGELSGVNHICTDPFETWEVRIEEYNAAMRQQAYWIMKAHKEKLVSTDIFERTLTTTHPTMLSALRGPDDCDEYATLKKIVTARIRTIVYNICDDKDEIARHYVCKTGLLTKDDLLTVGRFFADLKYVKQSLFHYLDHLIAAVELCHEHQIWDNKSPELLSVLKMGRMKDYEREGCDVDT